MSIIRKRSPFPLSRCYSTTTIQFVPEDQRYVFESEKLSAEEHKAAIPKRVKHFESIRRHFYDIPQPKNIADIIIQPEFHDIFITSLAKKKTFSGDSSLKMVSKVREAPSTIQLHFESKTFQWISEFNKANRHPLHEMAPPSPTESESAGLAFLNKNIEDQIVSGLNENEQIPLDDFQSIYEALQVFRNHQRKLKGNLHQSELATLVTFDHLSLYLLRQALQESKTAVTSNSGYFVELLTFIEKNLVLCSYEQGALPLLETLLPYLHKNEDALKRDTFDRFYDTLIRIFPKAKGDLSLHNLDKLAHISYESSNPRRGSKIIKTFLVRHNVAPSLETYHSMLQFFLYEIESMENETNANISSERKRAAVLRYLSDFKPLILHYGIDDMSFKLIKSTISTTFELDHLVKFIESTNKDLLNKFQDTLFKILVSVQAEKKSSDLINSLEAAQLLRRIQIENKIELNESTKQILRESYPSLYDRIS